MFSIEFIFKKKIFPPKAVLSIELQPFSTFDGLSTKRLLHILKYLGVNPKLCKQKKAVPLVLFLWLYRKFVYLRKRNNIPNQRKTTSMY